jgi:Concanavalin A-like lectin/glucanases superfamily
MFKAAGIAAVLIGLVITGASASADSNLVGQWHFDEGQGTTAADSSGYGNNGTLKGSPPPAWVPGRFGTALSFNGSNMVDVSSPSASIEPSTVSVSAWVKSGGTPGDYRYIVAKGASGCDSASYGLYTGSNGGLEFYISNGNTSSPPDYVLSPDAGTRVWDGAWHLVVGTFDGNTVRLYVDGTQTGSGTGYSGHIAYTRSDSTDLFIGNYPNQAPPCRAGGFVGTIDEVTVWNGALTAAQVSALEPTSGSTAPEGSTAPGAGTTGPGTQTGGPTLGTNGHSNNRNLPLLKNLRVSPSKLAMASIKSKRTTQPMISYTDTQAAFSTLSVLSAHAGVVKKGRCVKLANGKAAAKKAKRCTAYVLLGHFTHADRAGSNKFAFTALSRLKLAPNRYWLAATPSTHGQVGRTISTTFTIK